MKNLIKNSLVMVVLFTTLLGNANSSLKNSKDDTKTTLTLKDVKRGNKLSIKDAFGIVLYNEMIENSGNYIKGFDLTKLPDGAYFFELDKGLEIKTIPFKVEATIVKFEKDMETVIYKPFIRSEENLVYVSKLSLNKQPLKIEVYFNNIDSYGFELIHSETLENSQNIRRVYNLNEKGNYKIVTKTEGRTFIDYVQL